MSKRELCCAFCGKLSHETDVLLAGPINICICAECVFGAVGQIADIRISRAAESKLFAEAKRCTFCTPAPLR